MQCKVRSTRVINGKERFIFYIFYCLKVREEFEMKVCLLKGRGNINRHILVRSSKVICQQALNRLYQPEWNANQNEMKNTYPFYIAWQVLKLIIYKMQRPSSFISYLLYIFLLNGFIQGGDRVVSCTKKNLHHHYPLRLQNSTVLRHILKGSLRLPFFCSGSTNPSIPQAQENYLHP